MDKEKIKVLIAESSGAYGTDIASKLCEAGFYAFTRGGGDDLLYRAIVNDKPDIVIADLTLPGTDTMMLMTKVRETFADAPSFIITSDINNTFIERQVTENGADCYLVKPYTAEKAAALIKAFVVKKTETPVNDLELLVTEMIRCIGVPANIKGYHYLRTAIIAAVEDNGMMESVTKRLYPFVARQFNTTSSRVERAIRHAITLAWDRSSPEAIASFLGSGYINISDRPTNSEFIALAADRLRLKQRSRGCRTSYRTPAAWSSGLAV